MYLSRYLTEEEREKIKKNKKQESEINGYQVDTIQKIKRRTRGSK